MITMLGSSAHELYRDTLRLILEEGDNVDVRGYSTKEVLNVATVITQPWHHCHFVPGRRWNPWIAMSEALWILAGRNDIAPLLPYNKRITEFSDDYGMGTAPPTLWGAYGMRIKDQIEPLIRRLEEDPSDRRAILQIWRVNDLNAKTKDPPCNDMVMLKLRNDALHMTVINRSNDLHWGLYAVNLPTFGILQDWLAARLGVEMGAQTHLSNSLHVYKPKMGMKKNWNITRDMTAQGFEPLPMMPKHERAFTEPVRTDALVEACNTALSNSSHDYEGPIPFIMFANDFLRGYRLGRFDLDGDCRHADKFQDWIMAADMWVREGETDAGRNIYKNSRT